VLKKKKPKMITLNVAPGTNITTAVNAAIQAANASGEKVIVIPRGSYFIDQINIHNNSAFVEGLTLKGESSFMDWTKGTQLIMNGKSGYGINVQWGKGVTIDGFSIKGKFNPSNSDFYRKTFETYTDSTITDSTYTPYCGISIDYHTNGSNTGSTGTTIKNCRIFNTCAGVASSPNGVSRNAELTVIERCQFGFNKVAVAGSHDQERNCIVRDCFAWEDVLIFFSSHRYGVGIGGNWILDNNNIAGRVNTFIEWNGVGRHPMFVTRQNMESLGKFGYMIGYSKVSDSEIGFVNPASYYAKWHIEAKHGVEFHNCQARHYGEFIPINIKGDAKFYNCNFETEPFYGYSPYYSGETRKPKFINCYVNGSDFVQNEPSGTYIGVKPVSVGAFTLSGVTPKKQVVYELPTPPYGWYSLGIVTANNTVSYSEIAGNYALITK
jgi:hypothetical protein